jgi:DNA mismatch endonuclease (patch repair protein)
MAKVRRKSTGAEVAVRRELYRRGLRYRVDFEVLKKPRRVADIAFPGRRIAVFIDGCFWHGCPDHATWPKQNAEFWRQKIEANRLRDADTNSRLLESGWTVLRFWEHQPPIDAAAVISQAVADVSAGRRMLPTGAHKKK